ncbi:MAG: PHP domain-containing protein [Rectinemataceae bacterium]|nr:PHP domain-containing protein [Rectinemataceae bacterium]
MERINDSSASPDERLAALEALAPPKAMEQTDVPPESNNHIHTIYSFSPYTPAAAAFGAWKAGLAVAGSVDHDSLAGADEMRRACAILGMGSVTGFEVRVRGPASLAQRKINNPDSEGIMYMTVQGVPAQAAETAAAFLKPIREKRLARIAAMAESANRILAAADATPFDFDRDVVGRSMYAEGGSITERHLLVAIAESIIDRFGKGEMLVAGLESAFSLSLKPRLRAILADTANPYLLYDLLGILKSEFLPKFFIQPTDECVDARTAVEFAKSINAIPAYAYLGDVGDSPTGDKKSEKFEDDFLPELFLELKNIGFLAVTYMPPRNTAAQLARIRNLCRQYSFMEISGVDINHPRQSFNCPELRLPEFAHLNTSTWAMVAHEALASIDPDMGLFSVKNPYTTSSLNARIAIYAKAGIKVGRQKAPSSVAKSLLKGEYQP